MSGPPVPEDGLSGYLDGELTPAERAEVEDRLETSPEWRAILAEVTEARAAVRGLPVREAPSGFWDAVLSRGAEERPVERSRRWQVLAPIAATAAAAAVLVAVLLPGRETVTPAVPALVDAHAAEASVAADPISRLAPIGVPVGLGR